MKADAKTEAAVMATLNKSFEAYAKRDIDGILALLVPEPDVVAIGTGADEKCIGLDETRKAYERDFAQIEVTSWQLGPHLISVAGSVAWVTADVSVNAKVEGREMSFPMRYTAVLVQHDDRWLFAQQHTSLPAAVQSEGESSR